MAQVQIRRQTATSGAFIIGKYFKKAVAEWTGKDGVKHSATPSKWFLSVVIGDMSDEFKLFVVEPTLLDVEISKETYKQFKKMEITACTYSTKNGYLAEVLELRGYEIIKTEKVDDGCVDDDDEE